MGTCVSLILVCAIVINGMTRRSKRTIFFIYPNNFANRNVVLVFLLPQKLKKYFPIRVICYVIWC